MSIAPSGRWPGRPSTASRPARSGPAQVPNAGMPSSQRGRERLAQPAASRAACPIVVDSPPGMIRPSTPSRSAGVAHLDRLVAQPADRGAVLPEGALEREHADRRHATSRACGRSCSARRAPPSCGPTIGSPRPRETSRDRLRVAEVGRRLDDRAGARRRVARLEDAGADEHAVGAELHHHRGVGRGGDAAGGEARRPAAGRARRPTGRAATAHCSSLARVYSSSGSAAESSRDLAA